MVRPVGSEALGRMLTGPCGTSRPARWSQAARG
jgi:hypothetical protein